MSFLKSNDVEVCPSVPFAKVIRNISPGKINSILERPKLDSLGLITPRILETFSAQTLSLLPVSCF
jgi:hypothetical protein